MRAKQILYIIYVTVLEHEQITTVRKYRFRIMLNYDLVPPPPPPKRKQLLKSMTEQHRFMSLFLTKTFHLFETSFIFLESHTFKKNFF